MTAPIRVLELRSVLGTGGGPDKTILAGAAASAQDIAVTVCYLCAGTDDVFPIGSLARDRQLDYVEIRERHSLDPRIWRDARRLVRAQGIDIVHAHDYKTNLLALLLAKVEPVIPLSTAHGYTGHSWRERRVYYPADRQVLRGFPKVITVSSQLRGTLVGAGVRPERVEVVLNGIDPRVFRRDPAAVADARRSLGLSAADVVIGSVGRLEPQKRFDLLIDAVAGLLPSRPGLRLIIAGDGSLKDSLQAQLQRTGFGEVGRLVGHVADVRRVHHAMDLFVQSSDYEGTPNVVLEAMAMESPVVATDVGGTRELVTDAVHGLIVQPGDAAALAAAIDTALTDWDAARSRAAAARRRVEGELSFGARVRRLDEIYRTLMSSRAQSK